MNLKNIEIFLAIVKQNSISGAARMLHYTHPTVSESLKQLEKELGTQLVIRDKGLRKIVLTPAGNAFLPLAEEWMNMDQKIKQFIWAQKKKVFRLAAGYGAHEYMVSHIAQKMMAQNPDLELRLVLLRGKELLSAIESHAFDAALCFGHQLESPLVTQRTFFEEERYLLCPTNTTLPDRLLTPDDLDPEFEIRYTPQKLPSFRPMDDWRVQCFGRVEKPRFYVPDWMAMGNYLNNPKSWAVVPASIALQLTSNKPEMLTTRHITPTPPPRFCDFLISKLYPDQEVLQLFFSCCSDYVDDRSYLKKHDLTGSPVAP